MLAPYREIIQCITPGSSTRYQLSKHLLRLNNVIVAAKNSEIDASSVLAHTTLMAVRVFSSGIELSDKEIIQCLECIIQAFSLAQGKDTNQMTEVHAIVIDHLSRVLVPLFCVDINALPPSTSARPKVSSESVRYFALKAWLCLFTKISTVQVPPNHNHKLTSARSHDVIIHSSMRFSHYITSFMPKEYIALCVCSFLDNAELSEDPKLQNLALETLTSIIGNGETQIINCSDNIKGIFPGIASVTARIALSRPPKRIIGLEEDGSGGVSENVDSNSDGFLNTMRDLNIGSSNKRRPASVRSYAILVLRASILVLYSRGTQSSNSSKSLILKLSDMAKDEVASILSQPAEQNHDYSETSVLDKENDNNIYQEKLYSILRKLIDTRHAEQPQITRSLLSLFSTLVLDCRLALCGKIVDLSIESCLILTGSALEPDIVEGIFNRLYTQISSPENVLSADFEVMLEKSLPLFIDHITGPSEQRRVDIIYLITGYLRVLGKKALPIFSVWWEQHGLRTFMRSLTMTLPGTSLLISDVSNDTTNNVKLGNVDHTTRSNIEYIFEYYRTETSLNALRKFINQLISTIGSQVLQKQILGLSPGQDMYRFPQSLWLLSEVARNLSSQCTELPICESIFNCCVECINHRYESQLNIGEKDGKQTNAISIVLPNTSTALGLSVALDTISTITPVIGRGMMYHLDTLLFPLLEVAAVGEPMIRIQANDALLSLAKSTGARNISDMLCVNIDYIIEGCSQQLEVIEMHPGVFNILDGAVQLIGPGILVYIDDIVEDTLDLIESYQDNEEMTTHALKFFETLTRTIKDDKESKRNMAIEGSVSKDITRPKLVRDSISKDPIGDILEELQNRDSKESISEFTNLDDIESDETPLEKKISQISHELQTSTPPGLESLESEPPEGDPLAIKITLISQHFLSATPSQQLLSLKILQNTLYALAKTRDILPLINEVWPALTHRIIKGRDTFFITLAACDVIETVCRMGEDWMRQRVRDDLWFHFRNILQNMTLRAELQGTDRELIIRVLRTMKSVVQYVPLDDNISWDLASLALRFFKIESVQRDVIELIHEMNYLYGDKVWLILSKLGCTNTDPDSIPNLNLPSGIIVPSHLKDLLLFTLSPTVAE